MAEITIPDNDAIIRYDVATTQSSFNFDFPIFDADDLVVIKNGSLLTGGGVGYSVSGVGAASGSITLTTAAVSGDVVVIYRDRAISRETDFQTTGDFSASSINRELDIIAQWGQQTERNVNGALRTALTDAQRTLNAIPEKLDRASKILGFDASGQPKVSTTDLSVIDELAAAAQSVAQAATNILYLAPWSGAGSRTLSGMLNRAIRAMDFCQGDAVQIPSCAISSGTNTLTSSTYGQWTTADIGKTIVVRGAGAAGARLVTTITGVASATSISLAANASTTVSGEVCSYGTDDTAGLVAARTAANAASLPIDFENGTYLILESSLQSLDGVDYYSLPYYGVIGFCTITGAELQWRFVKKTRQVGRLYCDSIIFDSFWESCIDHIIAYGDITWQSSNTSWGSFWNLVLRLQCYTWICDTDQGQGINENTFCHVRCTKGWHIRGTNTTGFRECHSNIVLSIDTTGANLTDVDAGTGWHLLNDSDLNQTNLVLSWYAEVSGSQAVRGNFNIIGSQIDAGAGHLAIGWRNNYLNSNAHATRNDGDFLAIGLSNDAVGGEWDVLAANFYRPYCLSHLGTVASSTKYGASDCPSGINHEYCLETSSSFSGFQIDFDYDEEQVAVPIAIWYQGSDFVLIETDGGNFTSGRPYTHSSGWKLIRFTAVGVTSWVKLYMNTSGTSYKRTSINSIRGTNQKVCPNPSKQRGPIIVRARNVALAAGGTHTISVPVVDYYDHITGRLHYRCILASYGGTFFGIVASGGGFFAATRREGTTNTTDISMSQALHQWNTSGKSLTVAGGTGTITLTASSGMEDMLLDWDIELLDTDYLPN